MKMIQLGEAAELIMGQSPPGETYNAKGLGWPFFQGKTEFGNIHPKATKWCTEPKTLAHPGDILISVRAPVGPTNLADRECCIGRGLAAIRVKSSFDRDFVWLFLQFSENLLVKKGQGSTFESINCDILRELEIPDYAIEEQRQIASRLKEMMLEVEIARQAAQAQLRETVNLADAIIFESIRNGKTASTSLGGVLQEISHGVGESWADYPVLGATRDGLAPAKEPPGKKPQRYKPVFPGTVFYNPMRILIGSIAMVDDDDIPGITSPDYVALKGRSDMVDSRWFYYWLRSPLGKQCILSLARGAVRERMLFNRLAEGRIDLPSFTAQQKASMALAAIKPMRQAIEFQLKEIDLLPQKILAQAFEI